MKRALLAAAAGILILVTVSGAAGLAWMKAFLAAPADPTAAPVVFTIARGASLSAIADDLADRGLITDSFRFKLFARYKQAGTRLKAGEYQLSAADTPAAILNRLVTGKVKLYKLTIPEGLTIEETADLVAQAGICPAGQFIALARDPGVARDLDIPARTLEGYLYPDTYLYPSSMTCEDLIRKMTDSFKEVFTAEWQKRARALGYSVHEMVTLAAMIEKETGDPSERPLISSVFHNRLKKGMRLESDPTVIYGQDDYHGRIRYKHLRRLTPYNTYQIPGLPLGPIASPGAKALHAALFPVKSDYLFFVSKNDTTHQFSTNLRDHNKAVKKYQLNR